MAARPLLLSLHGGAGALFGVLLFVVLFSGAWSLGHDDLREWLRAPAQAGGEALALERLLERAGEEGVDIRDATLLLPAPGHAAFSVCDARLDCRLDLDPASGRVLPPMPALDLLLNLHKSLFVGFPGRVLVSLFGVSLLLLCLAGVLLHSRRWRDLRRWRRDRGLRLALFDLHGLIGIWGLPWLLLFGFTGALSGLGALGTLLLAPVAYPQEPNRVFVELMGPPPPAAEGRPLASRIDLDRLLAGDAVRAPGFVAQRLSLSHAGDVAGSVEIAGIQRGLPSTANFERHRYRLADGALLDERSSAQRGFWLRAFIAVQPLHFAQYQWLGPGWSAALRGLHLAMGLGACLLCASGLYLWLQRRASAPDARVRLLQRLSQGFCAGLVAAAALLLLGLQLAPSELLAGPWPGRLFLVLWAAAGLAALLLPGDWPLARGLLGVAGLACLAAAVAHLAPWLMRGRLPALGPDLTLILCGALLIRHAWMQARHPPTPVSPETTMLELYRHRRLVITLALLYLSQGIPIGLAMDALPTLLRQDGAPLQALAFLPLVGLPWVVKFLWAPWVDNHWSRRLGRRRSWILPMQCMVLACLLGLATLGLGVASAGWAVGLLALASLASATQDIATDGMAAEHFSGELLAKVNAVQIAGVMIGFFGGGAGSLILAGHFGQRTAFLVMACVPLASLCCVLALGRGDPHELPGTGRQGQPAALLASAAGAFAAGAGTAVGDDRGVRLRPVQAVPQRCRLGLAGHRPAGHERWPGHGIPRLRRRRLAGQADRPVARFRPWRGARRLFGAALVSAGRSLVGTERRVGVDLRADRLAGHRHHLGGDPHRGDALRRPGRPGRHRCHRSAEHPRPRRDAGVFVPGQPHRADRLCRRFSHRQRPGGAGPAARPAPAGRRGARGVEGAGGRGLRRCR